MRVHETKIDYVIDSTNQARLMLFQTTLNRLYAELVVVCQCVQHIKVGTPDTLHRLAIHHCCTSPDEGTPLFVASFVCTNNKPLTWFQVSMFITILN